MGPIFKSYKLAGLRKGLKTAGKHCYKTDRLLSRTEREIIAKHNSNAWESCLKSLSSSALASRSLPFWVPLLTSFDDELWCGSINQINPFLPKLFWSCYLVTVIVNPKTPPHPIPNSNAISSTWLLRDSGQGSQPLWHFKKSTHPHTKQGLILSLNP